MKSKHWVLGILLAILVVIFVFIINSRKEILSFKSKSIEQVTENDWNVYRNTKYGFEFKYPESYITFYTVSSTSETLIPVDENSSSITLIDEKNKSQLFCCEPITLSFNILQTTQTPEEFIDLYKKEGGVKNVNKITFAGEPAYEIIGYGGFASPYRIIIIKKGAMWTHITEQANNDIDNQILDSFVFN
jgi:hypothetical protein